MGAAHNCVLCGQRTDEYGNCHCGNAPLCTCGESCRLHPNRTAPKRPRNLEQCAYYAGVARRILADRYGIIYNAAGDRMTDASMHTHFQLEGDAWALVSAYDSIVWCGSWLAYSANPPMGANGETRYPHYEFVLRAWGQLRGYIEKGGRDCTTTDAAIAIQNAIEDLLTAS